LPVRIINPDTGLFLALWGMIDTGADECSIPADLAQILGHNLSAGVAKQINTAGGVSTAYAHTTCIEVLSINDHSQVVYSIPDTPIDFCPGLQVVLLGVRNFMEHFKLTIDYPNQRFSLNFP